MEHPRKIRTGKLFPQLIARVFEFAVHDQRDVNVDTMKFDSGRPLNDRTIPAFFPLEARTSGFPAERQDKSLVFPLTVQNREQTR